MKMQLRREWLAAMMRCEILSPIAILASLAFVVTACGQTAGSLPTGTGLSQTPARITLVNEQESRLPPLANSPRPRADDVRGVTRRPGVSLVSPKSDELVQSPVALKINFEAHGQTTIDLTTVKITYQKNPPLDLTGRLKPFIKENGIDVLADFAPGTHNIKVEVKDSDGRDGSLDFTLKVRE